MYSIEHKGCNYAVSHCDGLRQKLQLHRQFWIKGYSQSRVSCALRRKCMTVWNKFLWQKPYDCHITAIMHRAPHGCLTRYLPPTRWRLFRNRTLGQLRLWAKKTKTGYSQKTYTWLHRLIFMTFCRIFILFSFTFLTLEVSRWRKFRINCKHLTQD